MPPEIFDKYLEMLSPGYAYFIFCDPERLKIEKQKADILWQLIPKYYNNEEKKCIPNIE